MFFFQAEDGIRDYKVTGVQTCALPIFQLASGEVRLKNLADGKELGSKQLEEILELLVSLDKFANAIRRHGGGFGDYLGDRKSVVEGKSVDIGGRRDIYKKKKMIDDCGG